MLLYLCRRILQFLPVLLVASIAVWLMIYLIPGDPARRLLGPRRHPRAAGAGPERSWASTARCRSSTRSG